MNAIVTSVTTSGSRSGFRPDTWAWIVCAITVAAYGLAFGSQQVALWRIEQDPLALCLWVGDSVFTKRQINRQVDERVQAELSAAGHADSLRGCFPFRVCEGFDVQRLDGLGFGQARGRTVLVEAAARSGAEGYQPRWYSGSAWDGARVGHFAGALGSSLSGSIASSATAPGSRSGGGGRGSSGGGGGGGGGGGW